MEGNTEKLEPEARSLLGGDMNAEEVSAAMFMSIAISLKRIADVLTAKDQDAVYQLGRLLDSGSKARR